MPGILTTVLTILICVSIIIFIGRIIVRIFIVRLLGPQPVGVVIGVIMRVVFLLAACVSVLCVALICLFLFVNGIPTIGEIGPLHFLAGTSWKPTQGLFGIAPMILGSLYVTAGAIIIGVPLGLLTAIFMSSFCGKRLHRLASPAISLLAGIPSVVYGFFGLVVMVPTVRLLFGAAGSGGKSMLTASILLGIMILPTIVSVSESAIRAVPDIYYEGAIALGATHERAVFFAVLPAAKSGVMAAVILGVGRSIGETMAVIMVAGNQAVMPGSPIDGLRTMTANIVLEMGYAADLHREALIATSVVLFVFILLINFLFSLVKRGRSDAKPFRRAGHMIALFASRFIAPVALRFAVLAAAFLTALITVFLIGYILVKGIPNITPSLFEPVYTSENVSLFPALVNTVLITAWSLLLSVPIGVFSAIYLVEYARRGNRLVRVVRIAAETLTGIPSIVYGLFGMLLFVVGLHWGYSLLAGAFTLAVMTLPLIMRTTEEALLSVPDTYREGSLGLGAGQLRTVFAIVLPAAMPGILAGIILSVGRIVGETAALIFTAGTVARIPTGVFSSARTLSVHIYSLASEGLYLKQSYATAVLLLVLVLGINAFSSLMAKKLTK